MLKRQCYKFQRMQQLLEVLRPSWKLEMSLVFGICCMGWCCPAEMMLELWWQSILGSICLKLRLDTKTIKLLKTAKDLKSQTKVQQTQPSLVPTLTPTVVKTWTKEEFLLINQWNISSKKWTDMPEHLVWSLQTLLIHMDYHTKIINQQLPISVSWHV
jgi:hypothetical protein